MATYTPNYNLYKPAGTDQFDNFLTEFGNNMDTIDQNLGGGGGSSTLAGLSDVNLTSPTTDDALIYDGAEWVNSPLSAVAFSGDYTDLSNAPTIPTKTSDLNNDSDFVSDSAYVHTDNNFTNADVTKLSGIQAGAEVNVQSDWNEADNTADDYIKNKPTIPTNTSDLNNDSGFLDSSDITVTQVQTTGTKIATIDVDGNSTDLYAPTGGGSKHTIVNESGTALADEPNLQFTDGLKATDDSGNNKTKVGVDTTFTEAVTRANIDSGDTFSTILGKIKKFFTDLKAVAFSGSYNDLSDKPTIPVGSDYVQKSGDTMTGALVINRNSEAQATFSRQNTGTSSAVSNITLGNNTADGTAGSTYGRVRIYGKGAYRTDIQAPNATANRTLTAPNGSGTIALTSDIPDVSGKVNKSGDTMSGGLTFSGTDLTLGTANSNSNDSGDLVYTYGNGNEKMRIWSENEYTAGVGPNYRVNKNDGTQLYYGRLATMGEVDGKVSKSGDTMTGLLEAQAGIKVGSGGTVGSISFLNGGKSITVNASNAPSSDVTLRLPNASGDLALYGNAPEVDVPRRNSKNLNSFPIQNTIRFDECNSNCSNLPSAYWYYVFTIQGSDTGYAGQLALQMTGGNAVYYRAKDGGTWSSWRSL